MTPKFWRNHDNLGVRCEARDPQPGQGTEPTLHSLAAIWCRQEKTAWWKTRLCEQIHPSSGSSEKRARGREVGPHTQQTPFTQQVPQPSQLQSPCPPGGDITMPFCFPHVAMTRLSGGYLHRSTLRDRTLGANQRFFLLLCLGPIFVDPGRIPDFADGISCLISEQVCFR